jgi:ribonuclease HI
MPWRPYKLNAKDCWARVDERGEPVANDRGLVDVIYKVAPTSKLYSAKRANLIERPGELAELEVDPAEAAAPAASPASGTTGKTPTRRGGSSNGEGRAPVVAGLPADVIHVWTDGGARPNPGPSSIGVVIVDDKQHTELSEFLGDGTNQTAELTAMLRGLQEVADRERTVVIYSDSAYAIGLLSQGWKAKANVELVAELRALCRQFKDVRFVKVLGHSGISLNERTDQLATDALTHKSKRRQRAGSILDELIKEGALPARPS